MVNVMIVDGYLGAGKTLGMSILAKYFQTKSGCTLYSNYGLENSKLFDSFEHFFDVAQQESSIICLDEAHTDLDSRNFNTNAVKFFTHVLFYLRKLRTTIFLATPSIDNLDSRVRSICNLYCHVSKDKKYFYYNMYDLQRGLHLRQYKIRKESAFEIGQGIYDTYNMVSPLQFPEDRTAFNDFIHRLKSISGSYYKAEGIVGQPTPSDRPEDFPTINKEEVLV
jgi:hypothetical protein